MMHGLTVAKINWDYKTRNDPGCRRKKRLSGGELRVRRTKTELRRLKAGRLANGSPRETIIDTYLANEDLIWRGKPWSIGAEVALSAAERLRYDITQFRPYDLPWKKYRRLKSELDNMHKRVKAAADRLGAGMKPHSESLAQTKPWNALGIGRSKWFDLRKKGLLDEFIKDFHEAKAIQAHASRPECRQVAIDDDDGQPRGNAGFCIRSDDALSGERRCGTSTHGGWPSALRGLPPASHKPSKPSRRRRGGMARRGCRSYRPPAGECCTAIIVADESVRTPIFQIDEAAQISPGSPLGLSEHQIGSAVSPTEEGQPMAPDQPTENQTDTHTRGKTVKELRPDQEQAYENTMNSMRQGVKRLCAQAATGWGKTVFSAHIFGRAKQKGRRGAFVVPSLPLIDQTIVRLNEQGIDCNDIGVIQADHHMTDWDKPFQICSIDTIRARKRFPRVDFAIFDECHELHATHRQWMKEYPNIPFIGLTATPWAKGMGADTDDGPGFETLIPFMKTNEAIEKGILVPPRIFAERHPDLSGVKIKAGDYHEGQLAEKMSESALVADIVATYQRRKSYWGGGKTLCFAVNRAHARLLQERFEHAGIPCAYQDGDTPESERRAIRERHRTGQIEIVVCIGTLTTGVDWPWIMAIILGRPTRSRILLVQIFGRMLRTCDGKKDATFLDHTATICGDAKHEALGFPQDIDEDDLDRTKKGEKAKQRELREPAPRTCSECALLIPPKTPKCPNCGHEATAVSHLHERDGELGLIEKGKPKKKTADRKWTEFEKRTWFLGLKKDAIDFRAKRPHLHQDWVNKKLVIGRYQTKFGEKPDRSWDLLPLPSFVPPDVRSWIISQRIRASKGLAKHIQNRASFHAEARHGG